MHTRSKGKSLPPLPFPSHHTCDPPSVTLSPGSGTYLSTSLIIYQDNRASHHYVMAYTHALYVATYCYIERAHHLTCALATSRVRCSVQIRYETMRKHLLRCISSGGSRNWEGGGGGGTGEGVARGGAK